MDSAALYREKQRRKTQAGGKSDDEGDHIEFVAHAPVPTKEQVEKSLVEKRKEVD